MTATDPDDFLLAWFDIQSVGILDRYAVPQVREENIVILEVGLLVTTKDLQELSKIETPVLIDGTHVEFLRLRADKYVQQLHDNSGLWADVDGFGMDIRSAERMLVETLDEAIKLYGAGPDIPVIMAGSGVRDFDLPVSQVQLPEFAAKMHPRRTVDILDFRRVARTWLADIITQGGYQSPPEVDHRSLAECYHSIAEFRALVGAIRTTVTTGPVVGVLEQPEEVAEQRIRPKVYTKVPDGMDAPPRFQPQVSDGDLASLADLTPAATVYTPPPLDPQQEQVGETWTPPQFTPPMQEGGGPHAAEAAELEELAQSDMFPPEMFGEAEDDDNDPR